MGCHLACTPFKVFKQQQLLTKSAFRHKPSPFDAGEQLCRLLQAHIQPNQLKLALTCDIADIEIAEEIIRLFSQLPLLRDCAIRLGTFLPDSSIDFTPLQVLAERHGKHLTNQHILKTFSFAALPTEIQLQILSHTSLVTPYDLIWGFNTPISSAIKSTFYEARIFRDYPNHRSHTECCGDCSPSPHICSWWTSNAAFSSMCNCSRFPLSFFLVNKRMKELAEAVFYGQNHFRVLPSSCNRSKDLEIYNFLTWIPGNGRAYLRDLTWEMTWRVKENWGG